MSLSDAISRFKEEVSGHRADLTDTIGAIHETVRSSARELRGAGKTVNKSMGKLQRGFQSYQRTLSDGLNTTEREIGHLEGTAQSVFESFSGLIRKNTAAEKRQYGHLLELMKEGFDTENASYEKLRLQEQLFGHSVVSMEDMMVHEKESELASASVRSIWYNNAACLYYWKGEDKQARKMWQGAMNLIYPQLDPDRYQVDDDRQEKRDEVKLTTIRNSWYELAADALSITDFQPVQEFYGSTAHSDAPQALRDLMARKWQVHELEQSELESVVKPWVEKVQSAIQLKNIDRMKNLFKEAPRKVENHYLFTYIMEILYTRTSKWSRSESFIPCWINLLVDAFNRRDFETIESSLKSVPPTIRNHPGALRIQGLMEIYHHRFEEGYDLMVRAFNRMKDNLGLILELALVSKTIGNYVQFDDWMYRAEQLDPMNTRVMAWRADRPDFNQGPA